MVMKLILKIHKCRSEQSDVRPVLDFAVKSASVPMFEYTKKKQSLIVFYMQ